MRRLKRGRNFLAVALAVWCVAGLSAALADNHDASLGRKKETKSTRISNEMKRPAATGGVLAPNVIGGEVGISGATLFRDFFEFTASSNDWINPDCDFDCFTDAAECAEGTLGHSCDDFATQECAYRGYNPDRVNCPDPAEQLPVDRLVQDLPTAGTTFDTFWLVNYRAVGSTNGIQDFVNSQVSWLNSLQNSPFAPLGEDPNVSFKGNGAGCSAACQNVDDQVWSTVCGDGNACGTRCRLSCICDELGISEDDCTHETMCANFGCNDEACCPSDIAFPSSSPSEESNLNRERYYDPADGGDCRGPFAPDPDCPDTCSFYCMTLVDLGSSDVPVPWALQSGDDIDARWDRKPATPGYGRNQVVSSDTGFSNRLKNAFFDANGDGEISANELLNSNVDAPNGRTIFNNFLAHSTVAYIINRGAGVTQANYSDLQHHFTTGRFPNGLNLVAATRDSGSGTRNIAMNALGIDASWGRGENLGSKAENSTETNLGPNTQRSNCGGSSIMENAVTNSRLALGYTGAAGSSRAAGDIVAGRFEAIAVRNDAVGSENAQFVRPTKANILNNCDPDNSYRIAGEQTLASRGNIDANRRSDDPLFNAGAPPVHNSAAAEYLLNIIDSSAAFDPAIPESQFLMPAQLLSQSFFNPTGTDCLPLQTDPLAYFPTPGFSQSLQDFMLSDLDMGSGEDFEGDFPGFGVVSVAGRTPVRNAPDFPGGTGDANAYSDGSTAGEYCYFDGSDNVAPELVGGQNLSEANQLSGDFNLDGVRGLGDVPDMIAATLQPRQWQLDGNGDGGGDTADMLNDQVIPEVIGDFNGDGDLDKEDWRYFMDGLYINAEGNLDRGAAAIAIDEAIIAYATENSLPGAPEDWLPWALGSDQRWPGSAPSWNSTDPDRCQDRTLTAPDALSRGGTLMGGRDYQLGDFRADVAGNTPAAGADPRGADGVIDNNDVAYVVANVGDWTNIYEAVYMDLSADMNGDLIVDKLDIEFVQAASGLGGDGGDCFSNCPLVSDIVGPGGTCGSDGLVDINDIFLVLDEFQGTTSSCCATTSSAEPTLSENPAVHITVVPRQDMVVAGDLISVDVYVDGLIDLSGYQVAVEAVRSRHGQLERAGASFDATYQNAFAGVASLPVVDEAGHRIVNLAIQGGAKSNGSDYLGTFAFRAPERARGRFEVGLSAPTVLYDAARSIVRIGSSTRATIEVQ